MLPDRLCLIGRMKRDSRSWKNKFVVPLTPVIVNQMKKGAYYITSGILDVKEEVVVKAVKDAGLQLVEVTHQGEWVSVTARKE